MLLVSILNIIIKISESWCYMGLNNKGFAISGILYTAVVWFLLVLLSVLGALNSRRKLLEKNIDDLNNEVFGECYQNAELSGDELSLEVAKYTGKYIILIGDNEYVTYLYKGTNFSDVNFVGMTTKPSLTGAVIKEICTNEKV